MTERVKWIPNPPMTLVCMDPSKSGVSIVTWIEGRSIIPDDEAHDFLRDALTALTASGPLCQGDLNTTGCAGFIMTIARDIDKELFQSKVEWETLFIT